MKKIVWITGTSSGLGLSVSIKRSEQVLLSIIFSSGGRNEYLYELGNGFLGS
ncbi:Uncharacterised protein [Legionella wadsworthii]|uniref:Uncharacterized protein n=2 Tax=Legionella wadsworthii TaxID=28088 RepID=A0A378LP53_9GAMM|nr:Uncharacterised protein [Legionella wadsworthii]